MFLDNDTNQVTMVEENSTSPVTMLQENITTEIVEDIGGMDPWKKARVVFIIVIFIGGCTNNSLALFGTLKLSKKWTSEMILMMDFCISNLIFCVFTGDQIVKLLTKPFFHIVYCQITAYM